MNFPQQGYQPQQQFQGQQGQQGQQGATQTADEFFASSGGGGGAPSFDFQNVGDTVVGQIVDMVGRQRTDIKDGSLLTYKDGRPQMQLVVTLQTQLRGWQGAKKVPTGEDNVTPLGPEHDDGKRRIYLWYTLRDAVVQAVQAAGAKSPKVGDELAVRVSNLKQNPMGGNPIKEYQAQYKPGNPAADAFFDGGQAQAPQAAPPQQFQPPTQGQYVQQQQTQPQFTQNPQQPPAAPPQQFQQPAPPQGFGAATADTPPPF